MQRDKRSFKQVCRVVENAAAMLLACETPRVANNAFGLRLQGETTRTGGQFGTNKHVIARTRVVSPGRVIFLQKRITRFCVVCSEAVKQAILFRHSVLMETRKLV